MDKDQNKGQEPTASPNRQPTTGNEIETLPEISAQVAELNLTQSQGGGENENGIVVQELAARGNPDRFGEHSGGSGISTQSEGSTPTDQGVLAGSSVESSTSSASGSSGGMSPPRISVEGHNRASGRGPGTIDVGSPLLAKLLSKSYQELRTESPYNPEVYKCKGYDAPGRYVYFDGVEGTADNRFLIDLKTSSMERLRDVRPYLYWMGYWHDENAPFPQDVFGDVQMEDYFVRAGRTFLQSAKEAGRGFFLVDRDWKTYNKGENAMLPCRDCINENNKEDIGFDDYHADEFLDRVRSVLITNIRHYLPLKEVLAPLARQNWDRFIQHIYAGHAIYNMQYYGWSPAECMSQLAFSWDMDKWTLEEANYVYPDPHALGSYTRTIAQAREEVARDQAARVQEHQLT